MCYVNADIIFMQDLMERHRTGGGGETGPLMVGRRWNIDINEAAPVRRRLAGVACRPHGAKGKLYPYYAIDYFVFPEGGLGRLPPSQSAVRVGQLGDLPGVREPAWRWWT